MMSGNELITLPNFNLSVEELPLSLADKVGVEAVAKTLREIEMENPDQEVKHLEKTT